MSRAAGLVAWNLSQPACVVDARLALSTHGQLSVARLVRGFHVWIPHELHCILRDPRSYLANPSVLAPRPLAARMRHIDLAAEGHAIGEELSQWDRLPHDDDLALLPLHYIGERADECVIPPEIDRRVRDRCDQLRRGLYLAMRTAHYDLPRGEIISACIADTAALCAALEPYGAFILTRLEADGQDAPAMCDYLNAWGIPTVAAPDDARDDVAWLRDSLARFGLAPVSWSGVQLCAVHIVIPGFPVLGGADKGLDDDQVARLWQRAAVFWHQV